MYNTVLLKDRNLDYNLITQLRFLFSNNVSQEYLDSFFLLKGSVEGWKKGTLLRVSNQKIRTSSEKVRENLQLYTNQLANNNYNIIFQKIKVEVENTDEGTSILQDIILKDTIRQENNLELLAKLTIDLNIIEQIKIELIQLLDKFSVNTEDTTNNYDQFCIDNNSNLIFKNRYLLLCVYFNLNKLDNIVFYLNNLVKCFENEPDKSISERYILTYINCLKKINIHLKQKLPDVHKKYIDELNRYLEKPKLISSKSCIAIMNILDEFI
jgi:hypothetical protein